MDTTQLLNQMVQNIMAGNNADAQTDFTSVMSSKIADVLNDKKIELSQNLYTDKNAEEENA